MRYEIQTGPNIDGFRITDTTTDSRVASCYVEENAKLVCDALNYAAKNTAAAFVPRGSEMSANDYQHEALRTEHTPMFINPKMGGEEHAMRLSRLLHGMIGVVTEIGEAFDAIKKHLIYGKNLDLVNLMEEAGDKQWYIALILDAAGFDMQEALKRNIKKLRVRFPEKFTSEHAMVRNLTAERQALEGEKP